MKKAPCSNCEGAGWVCDSHTDKPWAHVSGHPNACDCGAGRNCPKCNPTEGPHDLPRMPPDHMTVERRLLN